MAGFHHGENRLTTESPAAATRNARIGLILFGLYLLLYGGFVLATAFAPAWLEASGPAGLPWSITTGVGVIFVAWLLAMLYGWLCRSDPPSDRYPAGPTAPTGPADPTRPGDRR